MSEQESKTTDRPELDPADAFALLSHETRVAALRVLWEADKSLQFHELADRVGIDDPGNFNYHLGELDGRFLRREDGSYTLTRPGRQAMTAVLTGDFTDQPPLAQTRLDLPCPYCGADIVLGHRGDNLRVVCTGCEGTYRGEEPNHPGTDEPPTGTITLLPFPAAGVEVRDPGPLLEAGLTRVSSRWRDATSGVCPDCGGTTTSNATVCRDHDPDGVCEVCDSRFAVSHTVTCDVCGRRHMGNLPLDVVTNSTAAAYFRDHGVDLLNPTWVAARRLLGGEEQVHDTDPLHAELRYTLDGESLHIRFDADGAVLDVHREG